MDLQTTHPGGHIKWAPGNTKCLKVREELWGRGRGQFWKMSALNGGRCLDIEWMVSLGRRLVADDPFTTDCCSLTSHSFKKIFFLIFWPYQAACRILVPQPGIEPTPQQWKHGVPTSGPSGNSLSPPLCVAQLLGWAQLKGRCWCLLVSAPHLPTPTYCLA